MFKDFFLWAAAFLGILNPQFTPSENTNTWGVAAPGTHADLIRFQIEQEYPLKPVYPKRELYTLVQKAIAEANPKHIGLSLEESTHLVRQVVHSAQCYGVDPVVFTALIWRESNFKPEATSETGAVGLTQMTVTGIHEVLDRLDPHSFRRLSHLRALVKRCDPQLFHRLPAEISADTLAVWKNNVALSNSDALIMGSLLLKINLASRAHSRHQLQVYQAALERYNGEPKIKVQFARDVLMLAKRMTSFPEIALNESKFLSLIRGL